MIGVLLVLGVVRGLWWQVMRLVGVAAAVVAARCLAPTLAAWVHGLWPELTARVEHGIAWALIFVLGLCLASLLGNLGQKLLQALQLGLANRIAGGCAGAATGLLVHVALVVLLCQLAPPAFLGRHVAGTYSQRLQAALGVRWPVVMARDAATEVERVLESRSDPSSPASGVVR